MANLLQQLERRKQQKYGVPLPELAAVQAFSTGGAYSTGEYVHQQYSSSSSDEIIVRPSAVPGKGYQLQRAVAAHKPAAQNR